MKSQLPTPTEHQTQNDILYLLRLKGWYAQRQNSGAIRTTGANGRQHMVRLNEPGTPDVFAFKATPDGMRVLFVEVKRLGNKPTRLQELKMEELRGYGAEVVVATSTQDLEDQIDL